MKNRPTVLLASVDGNIFFIMAAASTAMRRSGISRSEIEDMVKGVTLSSSYDEALTHIMNYVEFE